MAAKRKILPIKPKQPTPPVGKKTPLVGQPKGPAPLPGLGDPKEWGDSPPPDSPFAYTMVMPPPGYKYVYNQTTGARRTVRIPGKPPPKLPSAIIRDEEMERKKPLLGEPTADIYMGFDPETYFGTPLTPDFRKISPTLGAAEITPQVDPTLPQPVQRPPSAERPTPGVSPIHSKMKELYSPLPQAQQVSMRRIFRILPLKRRTEFKT